MIAHVVSALLSDSGLYSSALHIYKRLNLSHRFKRKEVLADTLLTANLFLTQNSRAISPVNLACSKKKLACYFTSAVRATYQTPNPWSQ